MWILDHIQDVKSVLLKEGVQLAMAHMAADIAPFLEASHGVKARRSSEIQDKIAKGTQHIYKGVAPNLVDVGHSAVHAGFHANQLHKSKTADRSMKMRAHADAHDSHMTAAEKLKRAGHDQAALFHVAAADIHRRNRGELQAEGLSSDDVRHIQTRAHVVSWKMQKLKDTIKARQAARTGGAAPAAQSVTKIKTG